MTTERRAKPAPYMRSVEGKTETMIPVGPHAAVNEKSAKLLGLVSSGRSRTVNEIAA